MLQLVYGHDHIVKPWICSFLRMHVPKDSTCIGIDKDNKLIGAALYHNYNLAHDGKPLFIEMSFGVVDRRWATRHIVGSLLGYPFSQLRVRRVQSTVSKKNKTVRLFLEHLGFKLEGTGRQAWPQGGDAMMYSLLSGEFFSSKWNIRGQVVSSCTSSTRSNYNGSCTNGQQRKHCAF